MIFNTVLIKENIKNKFKRIREHYGKLSKGKIFCLGLWTSMFIHDVTRGTIPVIPIIFIVFDSINVGEFIPTIKKIFKRK